MGSSLSFAVLVIPAALAAQRVPVAVAAPPAVAITHVTVIDVERGRRLADQTVLVRDGRIASVAPSGRTSPGRGVRSIDGRGRYVIPGLWDMHVHLSAAGSDRTRIPLLVANGVTGVRSMGQQCLGECAGDPIGLDSVRAWRVASARGERIFPRIVASGPAIDGPRPARDRTWRAATAEEATAGVRLTRERGADFVKVYSLLPRDAFFAVLREARRLGLPVVGHVPAAVRPSEAADSGMASFEHDLGLWEECSTRAPEWAARLDSLAGIGGPVAFGRISSFVTLEVMNSFDAARCDGVMATLAKRGTWLVPTVVLRQGFARQVDSAGAVNDSLLRFAPAAARSAWLPGADFRVSALGSGGAEARRERLRREPELVGRAHAAGVRILAGTDMGNPFVFPGFALHDELVLLVKSGLSPLDALRSATLRPAQFLQATDSLGTLAAGKLADLVVLDADPLADIRNTTRIRLVMLGGRVLDRATLDRMLRDVERIARVPAPGGH